MKKPAMIMMVALFFFSSVALAGNSVKWYTLMEGQAKSKAEGKPVILDFFYGKGCPRCEFLEKEIYNNPAIAKKINADFIPIRVDLSKKLSSEEQTLGEKYSFKNDCLLVFLDLKGEIVKEAGGKKLCFIDKIDPDEFIKYLDMVKSRINK